MLPTTISAQAVPLPKLQPSTSDHLPDALSFTLLDKRELFGALRGKVERETHTYTLRLETKDLMKLSRGITSPSILCPPKESDALF